MPGSPPLTASTDSALRRQMEQFFDATTDAIFFLDHLYRFTFLNRRAHEIVSLGKDLIGVNLFEAFPGAAEPGSPFRENYIRTMEQGSIGDFEAFYAEPFNLWFRVKSYPAEDGIMVFFRDVTQERRSRAALQRSVSDTERQHAELATIYDTAPIGLALFSLPDYRYVRLNQRQANFFGLRPDEIVGKTLTEMAPIEGLKELFDQVAGGKPVIAYPLEGALVTDPQNYRYWTVNYFPVYAPDGTIQAITAASLEITQQKKAELALIQSEKLAVVGRLASSIAHEINNPLESLTNLLYLAANSDEIAEIQHFIRTAEIELRRVSAITSQTLRFHKQATSPQAITAQQLIDSVLSVFQGRIANTNTYVQQRDRALQPVHCFEGEVRQVISNLIGNALDAMGQHGKLFLRTRQNTHWPSGETGVTLTIADTGAGMSLSTLNNLFSPFFTTKGLTGTGLGLWVSKEIIGRHRGSLRVRSSQSPQHHGTVFTVFLPFEAVTR